MSPGWWVWWEKGSRSSNLFSHELSLAIYLLYWPYINHISPLLIIEDLWSVFRLIPATVRQRDPKAWGWAADRTKNRTLSSKAWFCREIDKDTYKLLKFCNNLGFLQIFCWKTTRFFDPMIPQICPQEFHPVPSVSTCVTTEASSTGDWPCMPLGPSKTAPQITMIYTSVNDVFFLPVLDM